ncbi:MAG: DUF4129 domain-containing protein, partial [Deltaproteobacteria bacterium]|nr:DUF4129 domain-containing protein [Deltaproteobacteria bacterium]
GFGVILCFTFAVILSGTAIVLLFLPYLTLAAEKGYVLIQEAAEPLGPVVVAVLRFLLLSRRLCRPEESASGAPNKSDPLHLQEGDGEGGILEWVLGWGLFGLFGLALLLVCAFGAWYLLRWLLSRTPSSGRHPDASGRLPGWFDTLRLLFLRLRGILLHLGKRERSARRLYGALLGWGRRTGMSALPNETPLEYGARLKGRFPALNREIESIVESFNRDAYGESPLSRGEILQVRSCWGRMCSPLLWPLRFKAWFRQTEEA